MATIAKAYYTGTYSNCFTCIATVKSYCTQSEYTCTCILVFGRSSYQNFMSICRRDSTLYNMNILTHINIETHCHPGIRSILKPLAGIFFEDTRKKGKGAKTGASHDWRSLYLSQYDWLKGSHMSKVVWLPNETVYSYCEFVAPNTPYYIFQPKSTLLAKKIK